MTIEELLEQAKREEVLTVDQFAALVQYHPQTVWRMIQRGELKGVVRIGRSIRIKKSEALALS